MSSHGIPVAKVIEQAEPGGELNDAHAVGGPHVDVHESRARENVLLDRCR
jgi:hypothetical protein